MKVLEGLLILFVGFLLIGITMTFYTPITNSTAWATANFSAWQTGFAKTIPVFAGLGLIFAGLFIVVKRNDNEEGQ